MEYVKFGNTGMDVSRICLGMMSFGKPGKENGVFPWALDYEAGKPIFRRAIELGINYFDQQTSLQSRVLIWMATRSRDIHLMMSLSQLLHSRLWQIHS